MARAVASAGGLSEPREVHSEASGAAFWCAERSCLGRYFEVSFELGAMKVLLCDHIQPDVDMEREMLSAAGIDCVVAQCRTPGEVIRSAQDSDAIFVQYAPITREVIEALPGLALVAINAVGVDNIDINAAEEHGVWVCNVPDASVNEVATHALALALSAIRHLPQYDRSVRSGEWQPDATGPLRRPRALTLGILGLGAIGRELARLAAPCFAELLGCDPQLPTDAWPANVRVASLEALFEDSDIVSLHLPLTEQTRGLIGKDLLNRMKHGSHLVNVARGAILDHEALLDALDSGQVAGAALDVFAQEPPDPDDLLLKHPNVQVSPHAAYYSTDSEIELRRRAVENILSWHSTGTPTKAVVTGQPRISGEL